MKIARIIVTAFCAAVIAAACATKSSGSGSNSNWLAFCANDADCSSPLSCVCGVCTTRCDATSDCNALGSGATCDANATTSLCGAPSSKAACVVTCEKDRDCAALGKEAWCSQGSCRSERTNTDAGPLSCSARESAATERFLALLAAADKPENEACNVDADCHFLDPPACALPCSFWPVISDQGRSSLAPELTSLSTDFCDPYFAAGCPPPALEGCPGLGFPRCRNGRCADSNAPVTRSDAGADAGADGSSPDAGTCENLTARMGAFLQQAQQQADKSCTTDQDCTTVTLDQTCYHGCFSVPVSKGGASTIQSALGSTEIDSLCSNFTLAGCKSDVPPCVPLLTPPKCASNACVGPQ